MNIIGFVKEYLRLPRLLYTLAMLASLPLWALIACLVLIRDVLVGYGPNDAQYRKPCLRCGRMIYFYASGPVICLHCETPQEHAAHLRAFELARQMQAYEESR